MRAASGHRQHSIEENDAGTERHVQLENSSTEDF
jgi:hypothetical protein